MGPALVGLSTGDIASMAYNMQVAFATTVVGPNFPNTLRPSRGTNS